jgi:uncharacterized protein (UPF0335 family)
MAKTTDHEALRRFVSRYELMLGERKELNGTFTEFYEEVRQAGLDPETVRVMTREKALDPVVRNDQYALRDDYRRALKLFIDTPLGKAMEPAVAETETTVNGRARRTRKPRPFAEQPVHPPQRGRGRPRKSVDDAFAEARAHLGGEPAGTA